MHYPVCRHPFCWIAPNRCRYPQWRNLIDRGTCSAVLVAESRIDDFEHAGGQQMVYGALGGAPRCAVETIADVVPPYRPLPGLRMALFGDGDQRVESAF